MSLDIIGFGSLNLDEFWEVDRSFLTRHGLVPGREYVRGVEWFQEAYPQLRETAAIKEITPGGSAANAISALARMGFRTGFFGATGAADREAMRLEELGEPQDLRVDLADGPAGRCLSLIDRDDPQKDRALVILPNANDLAGRSGVDMDYFSGARWAHMTSFVGDAPLEAQVSLAKDLPRHVGLSFDPGEVYALRGFGALAPIVSRSQILFATKEELATLTSEHDEEAAISILHSAGVGVVVLKLGAEGLIAYERDRKSFQPAIPPRKLVDRTGAGDVAAAGYLAGMVLGLEASACLELAATAASASIEGYGRMAYPGRELIDSYRRVRGAHATEHSTVPDLS